MIIFLSKHLVAFDGLLPFESFTNSYAEFLQKESITPFYSSICPLNLTSLKLVETFSSTTKSVNVTMSVNCTSFLISLLDLLTTIEFCCYSLISISSASPLSMSSVVILHLSCSFKVGVSNSSCCLALLGMLSFYFISCCFFNMEDSSKVTPLL